jgi:hypothetical protein
MAQTGKNLQQLNDFNFEKWLMENDIEPLKDIINSCYALAACFKIVSSLKAALRAC